MLRGAIAQGRMSVAYVRLLSTYQNSFGQQGKQGPVVAHIHYF